MRSFAAADSFPASRSLNTQKAKRNETKKYFVFCFSTFTIVIIRKIWTCSGLRGAKRLQPSYTYFSLWWFIIKHLLNVLTLPKKNIVALRRRLDAAKQRKIWFRLRLIAKSKRTLTFWRLPVSEVKRLLLNFCSIQFMRLESEKTRKRSTRIKEQKDDILIVCKFTLVSVCYPLIKPFFALIKNSSTIRCIC